MRLPCGRIGTLQPALGEEEHLGGPLSSSSKLRRKMLLQLQTPNVTDLMLINPTLTKTTNRGQTTAQDVRHAVSRASGIFQPSIVAHHTNIANRIKQSSGCTLCVSSRLFPYLGRLCSFDYAPFPNRSFKGAGPCSEAPGKPACTRSGPIQYHAGRTLPQFFSGTP